MTSLSHPLRSTVLLLLLAGATPGLAGATPETTIEAKATSGVQAKVQVRSEYIEDEPMVVPISLVNPGATRIDVPDLATRPWLVEFHLVLPQGNDQVRRNSTPDIDPGTRLSMSPRGQRRVHLEVPLSSALAAGDYRMEIQIHLEGETLVLPSHAFSILPARPVAADMSVQQHPGSRTEALSALWLHRAQSGYDLYLHQSDGGRPGRVLGDLFLAHSETRFEPQLAKARSRDSQNSHIVWKSGSRSIHILDLNGSNTPDPARKFEIPWPEFEIEAQGITGPGGDLFLPLWIPAPRGASGTVQLVRLNARGEPRFERLAQFDRRPELSLSMVDDSGQPHILLVHEGNVDRYSPRLTQPEGRDLPVPGTRLMKSRAGHRVIDIQVVALPDTSDHTGAIGLLVSSLHKSQAHHSWLSLGGALLHEQQGALLTEGQEVLAVVPNGWDRPALAKRSADGVSTLEQGEQSLFLDLTASVEWQLYRAHDGAIHLRRVTAGGPIHHKRISP